MTGKPYADSALDLVFRVLSRISRTKTTIAPRRRPMTRPMSSRTLRLLVRLAFGPGVCLAVVANAGSTMLNPLVGGSVVPVFEAEAAWRRAA